jgi:hypothetical protein
MTLDPENRSSYIGSSDAKTILSGDYDKLWREKKGLLPKPDFTDNFAVQLGIVVEPFHAEWTIRKLNEERVGPDKPREFAHSLHTLNTDAEGVATAAVQHFASARTHGGAILGSHPDGLLKHLASGTVYPLEVKHTGRFGSAEEAAQFYMPQLQHHMFCWGVDTMLLSVVIANEEPQRCWIGQSPEWIEHYVQKCEEFWGYMVADRAPSPRLYDTDAPVVPTKIADSVPINGFKRRDISSDNRAQALIPEFLETKKAAKRHEDIKDELKAMMKKDENELYSPSLVLKRDARGAIRITVKEAA